ncbi:hypothetical protein DB032_23260 [Chromobacterium sp. Panama]|nr:hypothetical protein DB032_23260 [Chromobacterium sp. Panama]
MIAEAQAAVNAQPKTATLDSALRLQRLLEKLETRQSLGAPWSARFGLNRDAALLERLRPHYARAIGQALITPARSRWAQQLQALNQAPSAELATDPARTEQGYQALKAYLTLDQPARAEPAFLAAQLAARNDGFSPALLRAMAQFYAERLAGQPAWRIPADAALAGASRQTLIGQLGRQQADDTRYQQILAEAAAKHPPQTLAALLPGQDLRGLWRSESSLPGVFTRKAWDEHLRAAFANAHRRQGSAGDWVLGAGEAGQGLGEDWQGLGRHLFLQPLDQSWHTLLQPAAASLNQLWDQSIVRPWQASFAGRYPFHRSDADASLPELGRFLHPGDGLVQQFVRQQLGGVLEQQGDQWSPDPAAAQALRFDLNFLNELNRLSRLSSLLYAQGDAGIRFELKPTATIGLEEIRLQLDQHSLHYFNQMTSWKALSWPGDPLKAGASLQWQTEKTGLRQTQDHPGRWGVLRLLEQAQREQIDRATPGRRRRCRAGNWAPATDARPP